MGKRHASALAGIAQASADEELREAESRRSSAERERQLLTSYLGSADQVGGVGRFDVSPEVLKYTQRYAIDARALQDINQAGGQVKGQVDPFQSYNAALRGGQSVADYGQSFANRANDLLGQAEAAARTGDFAAADRFYQQAQAVITGISGPAAAAFNLGDSPESGAAIRASSAEGRIVGRQLLTAQELQDSGSATSTALRGRLLDPALAAVDESTRNAERAIASERTQIEGEIRQQSASGGVGLNARAQLALQSRASSDAALQRASVYTQAGAQKALITAEVNRYLNEFGKRMAEDSVALAQEWVNGTANVRDIYQESLIRLDMMEAEFQQQLAQLNFAKAAGGKGKQRGGASGALAGAAGGAAAGSAAGPLGALGGGILGAIGGFFG